MQRFLLSLFILMLIIPVNGHATLFNFGPLSDENGTGTATMNITISGNELTAVLNNTSPTTLDDGTGVNSPGITAFGFDLDPDGLSLIQWSLTAYNNLGILAAIDNITGTGDWILTENIDPQDKVMGLAVDYVPNTDNGIPGALYNPDIEGGEGALPNYYTEAILTLTFDDTPQLVISDPAITQTKDYSPIVRMQNVGLNGEGSLKLPGDDGGGGGGGDPVPEPGTMLLLGFGLLGISGITRKKTMK